MAYFSLRKTVSAPLGHLDGSWNIPARCRSCRRRGNTAVFFIADDTRTYRLSAQGEVVEQLLPSQETRVEGGALANAEFRQTPVGVLLQATHSLYVNIPEGRWRGFQGRT
jgi:hypothetical protein